jgi:hypothetical protein
MICMNRGMSSIWTFPDGGNRVQYVPRNTRERHEQDFKINGIKKGAAAV